MTTPLNVWMNGQLVGTWTVDRTTHAFVYDRSWLASPKVRSLSLSLPITASREAAGTWWRTTSTTCCPTTTASASG